MSSPFELYVIPRDKDDYGIALYQRQLRQNTKKCSEGLSRWGCNTRRDEEGFQ